MAKVKIQGNAAGTGVFTILSPDSDTDRTITLPDTTGTLLDENSSLPAANLTGTVADARISTLTSSKLTGALPAIDGSALTGVGVTGITSSANSNAMTIDSSENITISNSNSADTVLTIDSQTANGNVGILKIAGDVAGGGFGAGYQSAKINFFQSAEHICTISSKRSEGDEGELSFQTRDASDAAPVERLIIKKDGRGLSQFTAKAWVRWRTNQTNPAIRASHNVSSLTDNGVGDTNINFTNNLADAHFAISVSGITQYSHNGMNYNVTGTSTSTYQVIYHENTVARDGEFRSIVFGN